MAKYPCQALAYGYFDYRNNFQTLELIGICKRALCLKLRDIKTKNKTYYYMRGNLFPLTSNAKQFLEECL